MSNLLTHELLDAIRKSEPGRYLTAEEHARLREEAPFLIPRLNAMRAVEAAQKDILKATVEPVLKKYRFADKVQHGPDKCFRDVGSTLRHCAFAMVCDDVQMLKDKLLYWLRTILQAVHFPGGLAPIEMTYTLLYRETIKRLDPESAKLMEPFLKATMEVLPSKDVPE